MADDELVDDEGKTGAQVDPNAAPAKLATKAERNKPLKPAAKQTTLQYLADPENWNSEAAKKARRARWYDNKKE